MATINGVDPSSYVSPVPVPVPGTEVKASDVQNAAQALANQTKWLEDSRAALVTRTNILRGSGGLRMFGFNGVEGNVTPQWSFTSTGLWTQIALATGNGLVANIVGIPTGSIITRIRAAVISSGHSVIPAILPSVRLTKAGSGGASSIGATGDVGPVGSYDSAHTIDINSLTETFDDVSYCYTVRLTGESGTGSISGALTVAGVYVYFTPIA